MNLNSIQAAAELHHTMQSAGFVIGTDDVLEMLALIRALARGPQLANQARRALLDHDLEMVRNLLAQIEQLGSADEREAVR
jgi:hypothetical protein